MITGDNPLTACQVGRELKIAAKPIAILELNDTGAQKKEISEAASRGKAKAMDPRDFHWKVLSVSVGQIPVPVEPFDIKGVGKLAEKFDFCVYGIFFFGVFPFPSFPSPFPLLPLPSPCYLPLPLASPSPCTFPPSLNSVLSLPSCP
jgi:hypothetical protein